MSWHPECLEPVQQEVLAGLAPLLTEEGFYLAGGTAVALHLGHRQSVDLDWFTEQPLAEPLQLAAQLRAGGIDFETSQVDRGTLHGRSKGVRVSLLEYGYPLLQPTVTWSDASCPLASLDDLAAMKLSAIAQRGSRKDFVDIWALGRLHRPLSEMLDLYRRKFDVRDVAHVLFSLSYFDDADAEPMPRMRDATEWGQIKETVRESVRAFAA